jgi:hypothetical protein
VQKNGQQLKRKLTECCGAEKYSFIEKVKKTILTIDPSDRENFESGESKNYKAASEEVDQSSVL